jgi:hypothetical protein
VGKWENDLVFKTWKNYFAYFAPTEKKKYGEKEKNPSRD